MTEALPYTQNPNLANANQKISENVRENFINAMAATVSGVYIVTTDGSAGRFGLTVSAVSSVSANPPLLLVCINRRSPARDAIYMNDSFCINVLAKKHIHLANSFAGRSEDGVPYEFKPEEWQKDPFGVPVLKNALSVFHCSLQRSFESGSHTIFIGSVIKATLDGGSPLLYSNRNFGLLSPWKT